MTISEKTDIINKKYRLCGVIMKKYILTFTIAAALAMSGCSDTAMQSSSSEQSTSASSMQSTPAASESTSSAAESTSSATATSQTPDSEPEELPEAWDPAVIQRQVMFDEGYMCGVVFVGGVDHGASIEDCRQLFYNSAYAEEFEFITDIPDSNVIDTGNAYELYLIIPQDTEASVAVNEWLLTEENDFAGESGEVYYRSDNGSPFLLKCNFSDIMPNTVINIVDSNGNDMSWCPSLSLKDGSVSRYGVEELVYDFTHYADIQE